MEIRHVFTGSTRKLEQALAAVGKSGKKAGSRIDKGARKGAKGLKIAAKAAKATKVGIAAIAAAGALATGAIVKVSEAAIKFADSNNEIAKSAKAVNASVETYQRVSGAFDLLTKGGVDAQKLIQDLDRRTEEAARGNKVYAESFGLLGLEASEFRKLDVEGKLLAIADSMEGVEAHSERTKIALDLMGRSGAKAITAFAEGSEPLREAMDEIERAGIISEELAAQSEQLTDTVFLVKKTFEGLRIDGLGPLIPTLNSVGQGFRDTIDELRDTGAINRFGDELNRTFREVLIPAVATFGKIVTEMAIRSAPALKTVELAAIGAQIAFFKLTFQFQKGWAAQERFKEAALELQVAAGDMGAKVENNAELWENLVENMLTAEAVTRRNTDGQGDLADSTDEATDALPRQSDFIRGDYLPSVDEAFKLSQDYRDLTFAESVKRWDAMREEDLEKEREAAREKVSIASYVASGISGFIGQVRDVALAANDAQTEDAKKAAKAAFAINKAASIAQAAISTALAVINAIANTPGPPWLGIAFGVTVGVIGAATIAAIAAEPEPTFDVGGYVQPGTPTDSRGHVVRRLKPREGVLNPSAVDAIGGEDAIDRLNAGQRAPAGMTPGGDGRIFIVQRLNNRTLDVQSHELLAGKSGALYSAIHEVQPTVGLHVPSYGGS